MASRALVARLTSTVSSCPRSASSAAAPAERAAPPRSPGRSYARIPRADAPAGPRRRPARTEVAAAAEREQAAGDGGAARARLGGDARPSGAPGPDRPDGARSARPRRSRTCSTLLKSCAMPAASWPSACSRSAIAARSCAASRAATSACTRLSSSAVRRRSSASVRAQVALARLQRLGHRIEPGGEPAEFAAVVAQAGADGKVAVGPSPRRGQQAIDRAADQPRRRAGTVTASPSNRAEHDQQQPEPVRLRHLGKGHLAIQPDADAQAQRRHAGRRIGDEAGAPVQARHGDDTDPVALQRRARRARLGLTDIVDARPDSGR